MKDDSEQIIEAMVARIATLFHPERIVLFGSYARGAATEDSDIDLLVIKDVRGTKRQERLAIRAALRDCRLPKDIIVATPEEVARFRHTAGSLIRTALDEGRTVYDAAA